MYINMDTYIGRERERDKERNLEMDLLSTLTYLSLPAILGEEAEIRTLRRTSARAEALKLSLSLLSWMLPGALPSSKYRGNSGRQMYTCTHVYWKFKYNK